MIDHLADEDGKIHDSIHKSNGISKITLFLRRSVLKGEMHCIL